MTPCTPLPLSYVLPLRTEPDADDAELVSYLRRLSTVVEDVIVVDGSDPVTRGRRARELGDVVRVLGPEQQTTMGKVGNVITGMRAARYEHVVIADDDVRYEAAELREVASRLERATVVRPQNVFDPLPWHARLDTARSLLARVSGGDWPGTLAVRRSAFLDVGGYRGDVLFENLELVRTLLAAGGTEDVALDVYVRREPPTTSHFWGQQVRQAYDELARPARLVASLAVLPALALVGRRRPTATVLWWTAAAAGAAECGRRRAGGRDRFPATSSLLAGPWLVWRSVCSWVALSAWCRGGARYRDTRLRVAATPDPELRRLVTEGQPT